MNKAQINRMLADTSFGYLKADAARNVRLTVPGAAFAIGQFEHVTPSRKIRAKQKELAQAIAGLFVGVDPFVNGEGYEPSPEPVYVSSVKLDREKVEYAMLAASMDSCRPTLAQLFVLPEGTIFGTDGHRAHITRSTVGGIKAALPSFPVAAALANDKKADVFLETTDKGAFELRIGAARIFDSKQAPPTIDRLVDAAQKENTVVAGVEVKPLLAAMEAARKQIKALQDAGIGPAICKTTNNSKEVTEKTAISARFTVNGVLTVDPAWDRLEKQEVHIDRSESKSDRLSVAHLNLAYLRDALPSTASVELHLEPNDQGTMSPIVVESRLGTALVMPMRM